MNEQEALDKLLEIADSLKKNTDESSTEISDIIKTFAKDENTDDNYEDIVVMLGEMKQHALNNGQAIIQEDRPHQLRIAYRCTNTNKTWSIRIASFKNSLNEQEKLGNHQKVDMLRRAFMTLEGKQNLLDVINGK